METNTLQAINSGNFSVNGVTQTANSSTVAVDGSKVISAEDYLRYIQMMKKKPAHREYPKIGRNDLCPCGSGKKYKHCCLDTGKYEELVEK